jgi:hypothetical protein
LQKGTTHASNRIVLRPATGRATVHEAKVLSVVALFSPLFVDEVRSPETQEQLQEQLQVFPPLTVFACSTLISVTRFKV